MYGAGWTHYTGEVRFDFFTNTSKIIFSPFYIFNPHHQGRKGQDVWSYLVPAPIQPQVSKWAPSKSWSKKEYLPELTFSLVLSFQIPKCCSPTGNLLWPRTPLQRGPLCTKDFASGGRGWQCCKWGNILGKFSPRHKHRCHQYCSN